MMEAITNLRAEGHAVASDLVHLSQHCTHILIAMGIPFRAEATLDPATTASSPSSHPFSRLNVGFVRLLYGN